jgi:hypothetical protein
MEAFLKRQQMSVLDIHEWNSDEIIVFHGILKEFRQGKAPTWSVAERDAFDRLVSQLSCMDLDFFVVDFDRLTLLLDLVKMGTRTRVLEQKTKFPPLLQHEKRSIRKRALQIMNRFDAKEFAFMEDRLGRILELMPTTQDKTYFVLNPNEPDLVTFREAVKLSLRIHAAKGASLNYTTSSAYLTLFSDHDTEMLDFLELCCAVHSTGDQLRLFLQFLDIIDFDHITLLDIYLSCPDVCHRYLQKALTTIKEHEGLFVELCNDLQNETDYFLSFRSCFEDFKINFSSPNSRKS